MGSGPGESPAPSRIIVPTGAWPGSGGQLAAPPERWDIFCRVVDNFGDVGVAWRLARCVAREQGRLVRLYLDDLTVLSRLRPDASPTMAAQRIDSVEIRHWDERFREGGFLPVEEVADVVVETFGCDTPEPYVLAMAARRPHPRWINLEYLSAEEWVEGSHALPSPHPRLAPLTRHFFFPGFTARTGGLLRERDLLVRRDEFQADRAAQAEFWRALTGAVPPDGALKVSLFGYLGAPYESLLEAMARHAGPVWIAAPEGVASLAVTSWLHGKAHRGERGAVNAFVIPFLDQDRYDELLWSCDLNFVRGEDSFVRAQWAARPFVWHIYPTDDGAHWVKLAAFLARYTAGMDRGHADCITALWEGWNRGETVARSWPAFAAALAVTAPHAEEWAARLATAPDLATQLAAFTDNMLK
ncbi:MAG: elongation factor P maturation arginine rhamnosyltransferase EarP [Betaproteobacteria bacterium]|nr:elongation factor P maturation arginine rhamnosyltransferase EarP [Betaproteobacteria bacterium]